MTQGAPEVAALDGRRFELRTELSNLRGLLALTMLMTDCADEGEILHLATTSVEALARCHLVGVRLSGGSWRATLAAYEAPRTRRGIERQLRTLGTDGGAVDVPGQSWGWAYGLRSLSEPVGFLVVAAAQAPPASAQFLLHVLCQQANLALANARLHARERATSAQLSEVNGALTQTVHALRRSIDIHQRLTQAALSGVGQAGIAQAVHELTGQPVAIEDRAGNLQTWAGPGRPDPYPVSPPEGREALLRRAQGSIRPVREGDRLLAVAQPRGDTVGVLALVDPEHAAGEYELVALEHGATVLAMELARVRSLSETELRLWRDLVEDLLAGTDEDSARARADALGYDLDRPHRVVVVEGRGSGEDDFAAAARAAIAGQRLGPLVVLRAGAAVVVADRELDWEELRAATMAGLGGGHCRVGVGGRCQRARDIPRSYHEAQRALSIQAASGGAERATSFEELGIYRILGRVEDVGEVERFVRDWLGTLMAYDERRGSALVDTLSVYLACGSSQAATATRLAIHRSTLKYRLQRIQELSGHDLGDPDIHFNLQLATRTWTTLRTMRG